ncbi:unnamed protein product [Diamesa tonsa]
MSEEENKYVLSNLTILNPNKQPSDRILYSTFDVSQNLIIFGTEKTTGALFIYKKSPYVFHKAIPGSIIKGPITCIKISHDEQTIAFSNDSGQVGFVTLKNNTFSKSSSVQLPDNASATCFCWHFDDKQVYVGDTGGSVSVINLNFFIGRNLMNVSLSPILILDTPIVQIDGFNDYILVSSTTKTILCNNEREEFKQIGNRPRDGRFGSCFSVDFEEMESKEKVIKTIDQYEKLLSQNVRIFSARPGSRLWESDLNSNVLKTHQYKNTNHPSEQVHLLNESIDAPISPGPDKSNQFQTLYALQNLFIFTFNRSGFYIIDPRQSKILFWSNEFQGNIRNAKISGNSIFIHLNDGRVLEVKFFKLQHYALHLCYKESYTEAGDLIKNNLNYLLSVLRSDRGLAEINHYKIFLKLRDHLQMHNSEMLEQLKLIFDAITSKKIQNVVILSKNLFNQRSVSPIKDQQKEIEKLDDDNEDVTHESMLSVKNDTDESQLVSDSEVNRVVKQIYIIHQTSLISNLNYRERFSNIFDCYNSGTIVKVLIQLEKLFLDNEDYSTEKEAKINVYKIYFNYLEPELIWELDEKTLDFIRNGLILLNIEHSTNVDRCQRCEFPLNCGVAAINCYEDIGNVLQQFYWSRKEYEKCYELCRIIPSLLKIIGKFVIDERNFDKMISYVVNLADTELLHKALEQFNDISLFVQLIDDFQMAGEKRVKCLKCEELNDVMLECRSILTWDNIFMAIEYYLSGQELLDLLFRYSHNIPTGAISRQFYLKFLLNATE